MGKLLNVKLDEEFNVPGMFTDVVNVERNRKSDLSDEEQKNFFKTTSRNCISDFLSVVDQVRTVANVN